LHEASIAAEILMIVFTNIKAYNLKRVTLVLIKVGTFNAIDKESLTFAFNALTKGTACEGATIDLVTIDGFELLVEKIEGE